ncbi:hypothetical protein DFJ73DRAFT_384760 [Zopfochytrium polystomum]|nr:hypothetical protein DFJ73DRAFT_384760 [Zopfochytrium polystomum]
MFLLTPIPIKILVVSSIFLMCFLLRTIAAYQNPLSKTTDAVEGTTTWASCAYTWTSSPPSAHSSGQQALPSRLGGTTALPGLGLGDVARRTASLSSTSCGNGVEVPYDFSRRPQALVEQITSSSMGRAISGGLGGAGGGHAVANEGHQADRKGHEAPCR